MGAIIWLASYPKSGNTWMRSFLHNLLRNPNDSYDINQLSDFTLGDSQARWYQLFDPRPAGEYTMDEVRLLRPLVHREMTKAYPDSVFVKTHNALIEDEGHRLVTPEVTAGAIYVVRDPRDVAISYSHHRGKSIDDTIELMAQIGACTVGNNVNVYERMASWSLHVESWTEPARPQHLVVRYEDMLERPVKSFGAVAKFLGLDPPRARLDKAIKLSSFKVLQTQERRKGFVERPDTAAAFFREGKAGQWRKTLSPAQIARIEQDHAAQMRRFEYL